MVKLITSTVVGIMAIAAVAFSLSTTESNRENNTSAVSTSSQGSYIDLFQWNGNTYVKSFDKTITSEEVGEKIGEISFKVVGSGKSPDYQLKDGDATYLNAGTVIYKVKNSEDLAVKKDDSWILYEKKVFGAGK